MADIAKIKRNVGRMIDQDAPEADIEAYLAAEGVTAEQLRTSGSKESQRPNSTETEASGGGNAASEAVQLFGENFNRGLYATANAPTALANAATRALGIDYQFKRPLEAAAPGIDRAIMETSEPQTAAGEVAGTIGEYVGANALPGAGMIAAAPRLAAATAGATGLAGQSVNRLARGVAAAPGTAAAGEMVSSVGAGAGAQVARDVAPDSASAEMLGATLGGIGAPAAIAASPTNLARKAVGSARRRLSPTELAKQQRRAVVDQISRNMTPDAEQAIRETAEIQQLVPGYRPSVAEATESPDFIATQQAFERELSGGDLNQATQRYRENERAIERASSDLAPSSRMTPDDVFAAGRRRVDAANERLGRAEQGVAGREMELADSLPTGQRRRETGAGIRESLISERQQMKEGMRISAEEMGLNDPSARFNFGTARKRLLDSVTPRSKLSDRSALPSGILTDIENMDDRASIVDMMELRSRIGADIREAQRTPTGEKRIPYLEKLKSQVDGVTDAMIRQTEDPDLAQRLMDFRRMYREQYVEPFEQGAAGATLRKDITGAYKIPDEQVAEQFFNGWNQTAADQFKKVFKNAPAAHAAMEGAALDDLHGFAVRDGVLDPARVALWLRKNRGVLESFPEIGSRVGGFQKAAAEMAGRRATIAKRRKQVEQSYLARELARIDNPVTGTSPERAIEAAIDRNPARMQRLLRAVKSDEAKSAAARQVWDRVLSEKNPLDFIKQNALSISPALGARFQTAMKLAKAIEKNKLVPRPSGQPIDTNPVAALENTLGTGLNQISSRAFAVESGRTSKRYAFADIAGRAFRTMTANQARETLQQALYDPQIARDLTNAIELGIMDEKAAKRLYTFLVSNGIVASTNEQERTR